MEWGETVIITIGHHIVILNHYLLVRIMMEEEAEDLEVQIIILVVQVMFQAEAEVLEDILVMVVMVLTDIVVELLGQVAVAEAEVL